MRPGAQLAFKTDDDDLFQATRRYLAEAGWEVLFLSEDFRKKAFEGNLQTEHEAMFLCEGKTIKGLIARPRGAEADA